MGRIPAELTIATAVAQAHFRPRIWLAGLRLISTSAAILRVTSAAATAMSSLRLPSLRSLHCLLAAMASPRARRGTRWPAPYIGDRPATRTSRRRPALGHHE